MASNDVDKDMKTSAHQQSREERLNQASKRKKSPEVSLWGWALESRLWETTQIKNQGSAESPTGDRISK